MLLVLIDIPLSVKRASIDSGNRKSAQIITEKKTGSLFKVNKNEEYCSGRTVQYYLLDNETMLPNRLDFQDVSMDSRVVEWYTKRRRCERKSLTLIVVILERNVEFTSYF